MKKIAIALAALCIGTANAATYHAPSYSVGYHIGYEDGKSSAYNHVARAAAITGLAVIAGVVIYHIGKESHWTANEKGVVYRF